MVAITIGVDDEAQAAVRNGLTEYNASRSPSLRSFYEQKLNIPEPVQVFARDAAANVVGGVYGEMRFGWLAIDVVWISEAYRGQGLGGRLLQSIEETARVKGATGAFLDTLDFQARAFYEKQGYVLYGELQNYPGPHTKYLLAKRLDGVAPATNKM